MKIFNFNNATEPKVKSLTVEPKKCSPEDLSQLIESLYELNCRIFDGVDRDTFIHYVVLPEAKLTKIHIFKNPDGEIIGYFSTHHFEKNIGKKVVPVLRGEIGILPEYRRKHYIAKAIIKAGLLNRLRYSFKELYVLGCFISPAMYSLIASVAYRAYPNFRYPTPNKVEYLMLKLAEEFQLKKTDEQKPFIRNIGWISKETDLASAGSVDKQKEEVRFYLRQNPLYGNGFGLETLIPLSFVNMLLTACNLIFSELGLSYRIYAKN